MKQLRQHWFPVLWLLFVPTANAFSLGTPNAGFLARIGKFMQDIVDFLGGTGTMFVVFCSIVAGITLWVMMPKQAGPALGFIFRACIGAIALFGIGTLITWIKSF